MRLSAHPADAGKRLDQMLHERLPQFSRARIQDWIKTGRVLVEVDPRYFRPTEVEFLLGDPSKAHRELGWSHRIGFRELVTEMMDADLSSIEKKLGRSDD